MWSRNFVPAWPSGWGSITRRLSVRNPRYIHCAITGYGQNGPYRDLVGHDINYIAHAGALSLLGTKGQRPTIPHNLIADYAGGGMHAAMGIMAALIARGRTSRGQYVDISMMDGSMLVLAQAFAAHFASGKVPQRGETQLDGGAPYYGVYRTKDDKWITIGSMEPWFYANLFRALGREDFIPDQYNRKRHPEMRQFLEEQFLTKTRDQWFELLSQTDICVAPMLTLDEVEHNAQIKAARHDHGSRIPDRPESQTGWNIDQIVRYSRIDKIPRPGTGPAHR